ncbi:hypothetical protein D3C71_1636460 [compost metagenome]
MVILLAGQGNEIEQALTLFSGDGRMLVKPLLERAEHIQRIDAGLAAFDQGAGDPVDDIPGINAGHAFVGMLARELVHIGFLNAVDFDAVVEIHFFDQIDSGLLGFFETGHDGKYGGGPERARRQMHLVVQP